MSWRLKLPSDKPIQAVSQPPKEDPKPETLPIPVESHTSLTQAPTGLPVKTTPQPNPKPENQALLPEQTGRPEVTEVSLHVSQDSSSSFNWDQWIDDAIEITTRKRVTRSFSDALETQCTSLDSNTHKKARNRKDQQPWTQKEKERLLEIVENLKSSKSNRLNSTQFWNQVAESLGSSRTGKACQAYFIKIKN